MFRDYDLLPSLVFLGKFLRLRHYFPQLASYFVGSFEFSGVHSAGAYDLVSCFDESSNELILSFINFDFRRGLVSRTKPLFPSSCLIELIDLLNLGGHGSFEDNLGNAHPRNHAMGSSRHIERDYFDAPSVIWIDDSSVGGQPMF